MRKEQFEEGEFYHIYNRGVDKRMIFIDDSDRLRFVNSIYVLNNFLEIPRRFNVYTLEPQEFLTSIPPFVKIVAGCLMPNHYHLMVSPLKKGGVSAFFHKLGTSYTKYFNIKRDRKGRLFESTFHARLVDKDEYATYLTEYIHLNPLKMIQASQAKHGTRASISKLMDYPWSSLPDYMGRNGHFSRIISPDFLEEVLSIKPKDYQSLLEELSQAKLRTNN